MRIRVVVLPLTHEQPKQLKSNTMTQKSNTMSNTKKSSLEGQNQPSCGCLKCYPNVFPNLRFNVCPICGNKRCPHASDHNYECTNSNDVGQTGSVYGGNDR